jgi:hypothetical protein
MTASSELTTQFSHKERSRTSTMAGSYVDTFFFQHTHVNFKATSLNPFASNRLIILPTNPLWTPSGLTMRKVRSLASAIAFENKDKIARTEQITIQRVQHRQQRRKSYVELCFQRPINRGSNTVKSVESILVQLVCNPWLTPPMRQMSYHRTI